MVGQNTDLIYAK